MPSHPADIRQGYASAQRMVGLAVFAQGRPQNLAIPVSFYHAVEIKEEREEISSFFLLSLDDVCR